MRTYSCQYGDSSSLARNAKTYAPVNLDRIQHWIDQGRLVSSPEKPITARELLLSGCVHDVHDGIKVLGNVRISSRLSSLAHLTPLQGAEYLKSSIFITPSRASRSAIESIEKNGGKVVCVYHNPLALRDCVKGRDDRLSAAPTRRQDISKSSAFQSMHTDNA